MLVRESSHELTDENRRKTIDSLIADGKLTKEHPELIKSKSDWFKSKTVGGANILSRRVRRALDMHRSASEDILFCLRGDFNQALVALPLRVLVIKPGFMAGATFGVRVTSFMYADITGIEVNTGLVNGVIEILTASYQATGEKDWWSMSRDRDPMKVSNCLPITKADLKYYQPYLGQLRSRIEEAKSQDNSNSQKRTVVDQLKQLASLLKTGVLTQEEFDRAKQRILDEG